MLLLAVGFFIPWPKFGPWSLARASQVTPVMGASTETLQTQLRLTTQERDEVREQLGALERNLSELAAFTQRFGVLISGVPQSFLGRKTAYREITQKQCGTFNYRTS